jgi:hypothetical protein
LPLVQEILVNRRIVPAGNEMFFSETVSGRIALFMPRIRINSVAIRPEHIRDIIQVHTNMRYCRIAHIDDSAGHRMILLRTF